MPIQMGKKPQAGKPAGGGKAVAGAVAGAGAGQAVSIRPSDQVSEGLLDDVDARIESVIFTLEGPPNYNAGDNVPLFVKMHLVPAEGDEVDQWWSAGDSSKFQPSEDGLSVVRVKGTGGLGQGTNAAILFRSLVDAGFPEDRMTGIDVLPGTVAHFRRIAAPKRSGLPRQEGKPDATVLAVEKIISLPWEQPKANKPTGKPPAGLLKGAPTPAAKAKAAPEPKEEEAGDVTDLAAEVVNLIIEKAGDAVEAAKLPPKAFTILAQPRFKPHRTEILALLNDAEFLTAASEAGAFQYDGEQVAAAE